MTNPKPNAARPEIAIGALVAGVLIVAGLLGTIWTERWVWTLTAAVIACGLLFVSACIPQIRESNSVAAKIRAERDAE